MRLLDRAGRPWAGGGSVVAVCLPQPKARIGGLTSRTASFQAGLGQAVCPAGDEATGGSLSTSGQVCALTCPTGEVALGGGYLSNYVGGQTNRLLPWSTGRAIRDRPGMPLP